uniref:PCI domain-containing protein n=1 Tax=Globisporangium ultimum (strain ATCC 200006 / CBS 805.95 / DAOM BR144) TaxID=431595 RepID=K3WL80_GLOUD
MNPGQQQPPPSSGANAAALAGYSQFYATPTQPQSHYQPHQQRQYPAHMQQMRPPPPGPMIAGRGPPPPPPLGAFARGPPPPFQQGPRAPLSGMMMRPLPQSQPGFPPRGPPPLSPSAAPQWSWGSGRTVEAAANNNKHTTVISAPPVRYNTMAGPPPPRPAPPATAPVAAGNTKWPDSLHDYVKRAFARCKGASDQAITQNTLKELITNAITTNTLWTRNWTVEPLPTLVGDTKAAQMHATNVVSNAPPPYPQPWSMKAPKQQHKQQLAPSESFIAFNPANAVAKKNKAAKRKPDHHSPLEDEDLQRKNERRQRFHKTQHELAKYVTPTVDTKKLRVLNHEGELDLEAMVIKGTNQNVEKEYLRLTSAPHPSTVRPEPVLKKALELVRAKWKASECDYVYACSQLKSIRQDCTVQHIKNAFTVSVYESHARIALESGDINEFNQCQTQLHELYEKLIPGQAVEFLAYRILYSIYVALQAKKASSDANAGQLAMYNVLSSVTSALRKDDAVKHALAVREAVAMNDYHRFFQLYVDAPNMAGYLMDPMVPAIRLRALRAICRAYRPNVPIDFVRRELKLEGKDGKRFIQQSGLAFVKGDKSLVDTKNSDIVWVLQDQSSLI